MINFLSVSLVSGLSIQKDISTQEQVEKYCNWRKESYLTTLNYQRSPNLTDTLSSPARLTLAGPVGWWRWGSYCSVACSHSSAQSPVLVDTGRVGTGGAW